MKFYPLNSIKCISSRNYSEKYSFYALLKMENFCFQFIYPANNWNLTPKQPAITCLKKYEIIIIYVSFFNNKANLD